MNTQQIETIISGAVAGNTCREIAEVAGVHYSSVSKKLHDPAIKERVESLQLQAIEQHSDIVFSNMDHAIRSYQSTEDTQLREHGFKYGMALMQGIGILPSHSPSVFIQQINQSNTINIDSHVQALASGFSPAVEEEIIDCDYTHDDFVLTFP